MHPSELGVLGGDPAQYLLRGVAERAVVLGEQHDLPRASGGHRNLRRRTLFATTDTLDKPIAAPATTGLSSPSAARVQPEDGVRRELADQERGDGRSVVAPVLPVQCR